MTGALTCSRFGRCSRLWRPLQQAPPDSGKFKKDTHMVFTVQETKSKIQMPTDSISDEIELSFIESCCSFVLSWYSEKYEFSESQFYLFEKHTGRERAEKSRIWRQRVPIHWPTTRCLRQPVLGEVTNTALRFRIPFRFPTQLVVTQLLLNILGSPHLWEAGTKGKS